MNQSNSDGQTQVAWIVPSVATDSSALDVPVVQERHILAAHQPPVGTAAVPPTELIKLNGLKVNRLFYFLLSNQFWSSFNPYFRTYFEICDPLLSS